MQYNVIDIINNNLTDTLLKKIINQKLYKIIMFMEFKWMKIQNY